MSHPSHETLWQLSTQALAADEAASVRAHLELCSACAAKLDEVSATVALLSALPEAPPLPDAVARRVGTSLVEAFEADRRRSPLWGWLTSLGGPRLAVVAAGVALMALGLVVLTREPPPRSPAPLVQRDLTPPTTPAPIVMAPLPAPAPSPTVTPTTTKLVARVATARKARAGSAAATVKQELAAGASVTTEKGGSLWMQLPDGTRAGLTGASEVQLATLEAKALTLDLAKGSLAMLVPHREDRVLTVRAGDVTVKDLGTRFVVSREVARVFVAVEEGSVEMAVPGRVQTLKAGQAADYRDGTLTLLPWEKAAAPARPVRPSSATASPGTATPPEGPTGAASVARLAEAEVGDEAPPAELPAPPRPLVQEPPPGLVAAPLNNDQPDEAWAGPPQGAGSGGAPPLAPGASAPPLPPTPPTHVETATRPGPVAAPFRHEEEVFSLKMLERQLQQVQRQLTAPFPALGRTSRQSEAAAVAILADAGDCAGALQRADEWLAAPPGPAAEEAKLRRGVLVQKLRCLTRLGRTAEAAQVRQALELR